MNLSKLFEMQRQLDEKIEREHPRQPDEDRLAKKILALMVELGELANEARFFKYWSHDQDPRTVEYCPSCGGSGFVEYFDPFDAQGHIQDKCMYCEGHGTTGRMPLLEEYVDCLHFILSIGLDLRMDEVADELDFEYACRDIIDCFVYLNSDITDLYYVRENDDMNSDFYESLFSKFIRLGKLLGFNWEQVEQAYFKKNEINHERQESGY